MATARDLAIEGCNNAFKDCIKKITDVLTDCLAAAESEAAKSECKNRYKRGMQVCKEAHEVNLATVDEVFPPP